MTGFSILLTSFIDSILKCFVVQFSLNFLRFRMVYTILFPIGKKVGIEASNFFFCNSDITQISTFFVDCSTVCFCACTDSGSS